MNLGAHMSIAGGLARACERGRDAGCDVIQIFVKNERQWRARPLPEEEIAAFRRARAACGIRTAFAHDTYLINLASPAEALWEKSVRAFVEELERCEALGLAFLVTHPGSPGEASEAEGIRRMARGLGTALRRTRGFGVRVLLETNAGQGRCLGWRFEHLGAILDRVPEPERVGFCFDTCHVFAAGYDLSTPQGFEDTLGAFDRAVGIRRLEAFHLNDSKKGLGCRVDRHEHIGRGRIGLEPFRRLMRDPRFRDVPKVIETPKEGDMDAVNLGLLRGLAAS
ncbi:MAG TPA: deoxyribonuclease IV [Planctomycetota bacterium]|nr:deoxyribonuclease IV [Planctomycetota bacterium]